MVKYIDDHKSRFGVEPICRQLQIAPSTYYQQKLRQSDPSRLPARARRDIELRTHIHRVWHENFCAYGVRKTWKQLNRKRIRVARCVFRRCRPAIPGDAGRVASLLCDVIGSGALMS